MPTKTVTFLVADIEDKTRLREDRREPRGFVPDRHGALLRNAVEANHGAVYMTVGDAFYAAFDAPGQALSATLAVQQSLQTEPFDSRLALQVRMALHSDRAEQGDEHCFGPALNRLARLLSSAHGGQILLSHSTLTALENALPAGVSVKDLGRQGNKDPWASERVYQLLHRKLLAEFPPLRSLCPGAADLPVRTTSSIGREQEMSDIRQLLSTTRLLTLTGPGGIGKSRISLQAAADVMDDYPDGIRLTEIEAVTAPALIPKAVMTSLNIREEPGRPPIETLTENLRSKRMLLILDGCEHLLEACRQFVHRLLADCRELRILAASRAPLNLPGELIYIVSSPSLANTRDAVLPQSPEPLSGGAGRDASRDAGTR